MDIKIDTSNCTSNPPSQKDMDAFKEATKGWTDTSTLWVFENPMCDLGNGECGFGYRILPFTIGSEVYARRSKAKATIQNITPVCYGFMNCHLDNGTISYAGDLMPAEIYEERLKNGLDPFRS